jgi:ABC-type transport system involved in multi-copper enzyme maturation permease subunit
VFDNVRVGATAATWVDDDVFPPGARLDPAEVGSSARAGGTVTVIGSGDVTGYGIASWRFGGDDDTVITSLSGVQVGLMAVVALGVLFATSEYKTGTIRTTFAASPRRGRVLAAKVIVLGGAMFASGLVACVAAFLITQPTLRANGYRPPVYAELSLTDGPVLRAVLGTALFLAVLAVFSLGVGAIRRRTVGAIVIVTALVVVPQIIAPIMSLSAELWINRLTPVAGLAIQQSRERFDTAIGPWTGLGVLCVYAAVALFLAFWRLRRRDA